MSGRAFIALASLEKVPLHEEILKPLSRAFSKLAEDLAKNQPERYSFSKAVRLALLSHFKPSHEIDSCSGFLREFLPPITAEAVRKLAQYGFSEEEARLVVERISDSQEKDETVRRACRAIIREICPLCLLSAKFRFETAKVKENHIEVVAVFEEVKPGSEVAVLLADCLDYMKDVGLGLTVKEYNMHVTLDWAETFYYIYVEDRSVRLTHRQFVLLLRSVATVPLEF